MIAPAKPAPKKPPCWKGASRRMYEPGAKVASMQELASALEAGRWVFINHKPYHPGWLVSMTYHSLRLYVRAGRVRVAVLTEYGARKMAERKEAKCD